MRRPPPDADGARIDAAPTRTPTPRVAGGDTRYSVVDDVVFGRDLDGSSEVEGQVSRAMAGGSAAFGGKGGKGAYAPSRASLVGEVGLRWDPDDPSYHRGNAAMLAPIDGGKRTEQYVSPLALPPSPERKESPQGRHSRWAEHSHDARPSQAQADAAGRATWRHMQMLGARVDALHADAAHLNGARALPGHPADYHPANDERGGVAVVGHRRSLAPSLQPGTQYFDPAAAAAAAASPSPSPSGLSVVGRAGAERRGSALGYGGAPGYGMRASHSTPTLGRSGPPPPSGSISDRPRGGLPLAPPPPPKAASAHGEQFWRRPSDNEMSAFAAWRLGR